jgi:hypothetical protein
MITKNQNSSAKKFRNASSYTYSPSYTFPGNLPTELYRKPTVGTPKLTDMFKIIQPIRTDEYLILVGNLSKIVKAATGCNPSFTTSGTFSDRKITVGNFEANMSWCKSDFMATASALTNDPSIVKNGLDGYNLQGAVRTVWMEEMIDAIRRDLWRILLFSNDTAASSDYNVIEGLFVKLYDANSAYCVKRVGNDLPNTTAAVLTADQAYNAIKATHQGASTILKQLPINQKVFWVNGAMYENLMSSYESKTNGATELQFKMILDGSSAGVGTGNVVSPDGGPTLTYRGIPVIPLYFADDALADTSNPWYGSLANFVIYTTTGNSKFGNLVVGMEAASDLDKIEMYYYQHGKTTEAQWASRFGTQFIQCDLIAFYD